MKATLLRTLHALHSDEAGQDLIEYALVAFLIAFAAVLSMQGLAYHINTAFSKIGSELGSITG